MDELLKYKTLCANLEYNNNFSTNANDDNLRGFTNEIIKNKKEADLLLNWINERGTNLKIVKRLYKPDIN